MSSGRGPLWAKLYEGKVTPFFTRDKFRETVLTSLKERLESMDGTIEITEEKETAVTSMYHIPHWGVGIRFFDKPQERAVGVYMVGANPDNILLVAHALAYCHQESIEKESEE